VPVPSTCFDRHLAESYRQFDGCSVLIHTNPSVARSVLWGTTNLHSHVQNCVASGVSLVISLDVLFDR